MKASWQVRSGTDADLGAVLELQRALAKAPQWGEGSYRESLGSWELREGGRVRRLLVAVESADRVERGHGRGSRQTGDGDAEIAGMPGSESRVIGFVVGQVTRIGREVEAEIESVAVAEAHRRAGVGRTLCVELLEWFRTMEAGRVALEVRSGSEGAIALYRSLGFTEQGRRRRYYSDPEDDALLMRLEGAGGR